MEEKIYICFCNNAIWCLECQSYMYVHGKNIISEENKAYKCLIYSQNYCTILPLVCAKDIYTTAYIVGVWDLQSFWRGIHIFALSCLNPASPENLACALFSRLCA